MKSAFTKKFISSVLSLSLTVSLLLPAQQNTYASTLNTDNNYLEKDTVPAPETGELQIVSDEKELAIIGEDISSRDMYTKDFLLEGTMHLLVVYPDAVHYQDSGKWAEIDNTLILDKNPSGNAAYRNTANSVSMWVPEILGPEADAGLSFEDHTISMSLAGMQAGDDKRLIPAEKRAAEITNGSASADEMEKLTERMKRILPYKTESHAFYRDVFPEMDVIYDLCSAAFEESVVIRKPQEESITYVYRINAGDMTLKLTEKEGILAYTKEGDEVFTISEPYLFDAEGEGCWSIDTTLELLSAANAEHEQSSDEIKELIEAEQNPEEREAEDEEAALDQKTTVNGEKDEADPIDTDTAADLPEELEEDVLAETADTADASDLSDTLDISELSETADESSIDAGTDNPNISDTLAPSPVPDSSDSSDQSDTLDDPDMQDTADVQAATEAVGNAEPVTTADTIEVIPTGNIYTLTYTLPKDWLASEDRVYPVTMDPQIQTRQIRQNIRDVTVSEHSEQGNNWAYLEAGYQRTRGIERALVKFRQLPALTSADVVVNADLLLARGTDSSETLDIRAHRVLGDWESETVTWSTQPSFDSTITDYCKVDSISWYDWKITELVRDWYRTGNRGVLLKAPDETENAGTHNNRTFYSSDYSSSSYRPVLTLQYINNCGYESYWDYDSYDMGRGGTLGVNLYTGNAVVSRTDLAFTGNLMPVSIDFVFNMNDKTYTNSSGTAVSGGRFGLGNGWRTAYNQLVYQFTASEGTSTGSTTYYIWEDEDGTRHYFKKTSTSGTYKDESGAELTLKTTGSGDSKYTITDKDGNVSTFDSSGRLRKIMNNQATKSSILITYKPSGNTGRIDTITDGAGRKYSFSYNSSTGLISSIAYKGSGSTAIKSVSYQHSSGNLTRVTCSDGVKADYTYSSNAMTRVTDDYGTRFDLTYDTTDADAPSRLIRVKETDKNGSGNYYETGFDYNNCYTIVSDGDGNELEYQFNYYGNTISLQDKEGRALYSKYATDEEGASSSAVKNRLKLASKLQPTTINLLKNGSFERDESMWSVTREGGSAGTGAYSSTEKYLGKDSYCLTKTGTAGCMRLAYTEAVADGTAAVAGTSASTASGLVPGTAYTLSAYIKTSDITESTSGNGVALAVTINGTETTGEYTKTSTGWQRIELTFTTPATGNPSVVPSVRLNSPGTVYIDCMQLEKSAGASRYNLIENPDFTYAGTLDTESYQWSEGIGCRPGDDRVIQTSGLSEIPTLDHHVYQVRGDSERQKRCYQEIDIKGVKGDTYSVGGWAKGNAAPYKDSTYSNRNVFAIVVRFYNTDGSETEQQVKFNTDLYAQDTWQYACEAVVAKKNYNSIRVLLCYELNVNSVCFDGIQMVKDEFGNSYTYDSDGNVISVQDLQKKNTSYEYSSNNLTKAVLPSGAQYTYTYDSYHNVTVAKSATNVQNKFTYDSKGNNTSVKITDPGNSSAKIIEASSTYTTDGNYTATVTDGSRNTTTYGYDTQTGELDWVSAPGENTSTRTGYTYDNAGRLSQTAKNVSGLTDTGDAQVSYTYQKDSVKTIVHGSTGSTDATDTDTTYTFNYGLFGALTQVKAGDHPLISHSYDTSSTQYNLASSTYGNGGRIDYSYDRYGNLTEKKYDGDSSDKVKYSYDTEGGLAVREDVLNNIRTKLLYDLSGRLTGIVNSGSRDHKISYGYNSENNVSAVTSRVEGTTTASSYTYDTDSRLTSSQEGTVKEEVSYDAYGRTGSQTIKNGSNTILTQTIGYANPDSSHTSLLPNSVTNTIAGGSTISYSYIYDDKGNITSVADNNGNTTTYSYDGLSQLIRENSQEAGKTWTYSYDSAGNIREKKEYAYTTGSLGTPADTTIYSYGDATWKDILTGVNGTPYTSDAIGNLTNDGEWTYTWQHGRQLAGMSRPGTDIAFTYDAEGLRLSKTVTEGSTTTEYKYYYQDGNLTDMIWGTSRLHIFYDGNGSPVSFTYGGSTYYYVKNLQGDITAITDANGSIITQYSYDAWGNPISTTGSQATTIGAINPLRYRGYVWDQESGLYYLHSRYYSWKLQKFFCADALIPGSGSKIEQNNLYKYCLNNPIKYDDRNGYWAKWFETTIKACSVILLATATIAFASAVVSIATGAVAFSAGVSAVTGASLVLSATLSGINGGVANESKGGSYTNGFIGGGTGNYISTKFGTKGRIAKKSVGNGIGNAVGTVITKTLDNVDPYSPNTSFKQLSKDAAVSFRNGCASGFLSSYMNSACNDALINPDSLMDSYSYADCYTMQIAFGWITDAFAYIWE